jgi:hypothetical protein
MAEVSRGFRQSLPTSVEAVIWIMLRPPHTAFANRPSIKRFLYKQLTASPNKTRTENSRREHLGQNRRNSQSLAKLVLPCFKDQLSDVTQRHSGPRRHSTAAWRTTTEVQQLICWISKLKPGRNNLFYLCLKGHASHKSSDHKSKCANTGSQLHRHQYNSETQNHWALPDRTSCQNKETQAHA